ncbi:MAG: hypothetical protein KF862_27520 [Chitinophagaceae bacterium]|nr:hypothetical protein [Chitinophagaceae bacterium]
MFKKKLYQLRDTFIAGIIFLLPAHWRYWSLLSFYEKDETFFPCFVIKQMNNGLAIEKLIANKTADNENVT